MGGRRHGGVKDSGAAALPPVALRAYARHRRCTLAAVQKAITTGRLRASLLYRPGKPIKIRSVAEADREWDAHTNAVKALPSAMAKEAAAVIAAPPAASIEPAAGDESKPPTLQEAMAREKDWKARLAELDYRERMGQLVSAGQVESKMVETFTRCRTKMLGLPSKLKTAIPHLTRADLVVVDRFVREALEELVVVDDTAQGAA